MINLSTQYPGRIDPPSGAWPWGEPRNELLPGAGDGTPWEEALGKDLIGFLHALLHRANLSVSGNPENAHVSQGVEAIEQIVALRYPVVTTTEGVPVTVWAPTMPHPGARGNQFMISITCENTDYMLICVGIVTWTVGVFAWKPLDMANCTVSLSNDRYLVGNQLRITTGGGAGTRNVRVTVTPIGF